MLMKSNKIEFLQNSNDAYLKDEAQGYLKVIRDELENNISIMDLQLFSDKDKQKQVCSEIIKELEANSYNMETHLKFKNLHDNEKCWQIGIKHIKLCLRYYVEI